MALIYNTTAEEVFNEDDNKLEIPEEILEYCKAHNLNILTEEECKVINEKLNINGGNNMALSTEKTVKYTGKANYDGHNPVKKVEKAYAKAKLEGKDGKAAAIKYGTIGGAVVVTGAIGYGTYKLIKHHNDDDAEDFSYYDSI